MVVVCECVAVQECLPMADTRPGCAHCGAPTPPGKWRCVKCQADHDARRDADIAAKLAAVREARREASAEAHDAG